jgi:two-component system LytT family response regulator
MEERIRTVLVDDDKVSLITLESLLKKNFPNVLITGKAHDVSEAVRVIGQQAPQLVFLDISLPDGEGFDVIEKMPGTKFEVIFITAYD